MIRVFRHALSLDEHRSRFRPEFWTRPTEFQLTKVGTTAQEKSGLPPTSVEEVWFAVCSFLLQLSKERSKVYSDRVVIVVRFKVFFYTEKCHS